MNNLKCIFDKIAAKYNPKRNKMQHFKKFSRGSICLRPP